METCECVTTRSVTRAYKPEGVSKELLVKILDEARNCASAENTQPWEFAVFTGDVMETVRNEYLDRFDKGVETNPDIPHSAEMWPEEYRGRIIGEGPNLLDVLGINPEDMEARKNLWRRGIGFWGAPTGIILYMDRNLPQLSMADMGSMLTTVMLLAHCNGLGTCPTLQMVMYPDIIREHLNIPDSKMIYTGISIGSPDKEDPINTFKAFRLPLDKMANWYGFPE